MKKKLAHSGLRDCTKSGHGAAIAGLLAMAAIAAIGGYYWLTRGVAPAPPATESAPTEAKQPPPEGKAKPDSLKPTEPPPADHPFMALLDRPDFILTPHVAWASDEALQGLADQLVDNVEAFVRGEPANVVTA